MNDLAVIYEHVVGKDHCLVLVVRYVDEGRAGFGVNALHFRQHVLVNLQVERSQQLVEQQHLRFIGEGARDVLALAPRSVR